MIHQQIINSPFQLHLGFMEPDSTTFPPHLGSSFATRNLMTSLIDHHQDNNNNFRCTKEMLHNNPSPMEAMREMMFRIAAMQPVRIDPDSVKPRKRRNVRISNDPQSVAARHRRERISERIRILQRLVPGGTKMDTASMLDEAVRYLKFLKREVKSLEEMAVSPLGPPANCVATSTRSTWGFRVPYSIMHSNVVGEGM